MLRSVMHRRMNLSLTRGGIDRFRLEAGRVLSAKNSEIPLRAINKGSALIGRFSPSAFDKRFFRDGGSGYNLG